MKQNDKIQEEVEMTLGSTEKIRKAEPNPFLFDKIMYRMETESQPNHAITIRFKYVLAILILVALNVLTVIHFNSEKSDIETQSRISNFDEEYSVTFKLNYN
jgi:hypothetical protein